MALARRWTLRGHACLGLAFSTRFAQGDGALPIHIFQRARSQIKPMSNAMNASHPLPEPWIHPWPTDGLESVTVCPVCGETAREILHSDLVDNVFRVAPGKWKLWRCTDCSAAYLDPRPTRDAIHLAYANYYTHQEAAEEDDYTSLSPFRKLRRRLANGYTNWRFSTQAPPSSPLGVTATLLMPPLKKRLDCRYRHLPKLPARGRCLLDVGCGNGAFLNLARTCGWDVIGLDSDPQAAINAAKQGLSVKTGGIEVFDSQSEVFDVITLNHVIEHVHEPVKVLKACHALLKPGGQLWLGTPNIDSFGHERFQKSWRGLETPRHLVIFNRRSLIRALVKAGFSTPRERVCPSACPGMFQASHAIAQGQSPYSTVETPRVLQLRAWLASVFEMIRPSRREFLTLSASKQVS